MKKCSIRGCAGKYYAKGYCKPHYNHARQYGDSLIYKKGFSLEEKFWSKVDKRGKNECWEWQAYKGHFGYGYMGFKKNGKWKQEGAHRISYRLHKGELPDGVCVLHECDNPSCVNPAHLFIGDRTDNHKDMEKKGRARGRCSYMEKKITCGHPKRKYHAKGMCKKCYRHDYYIKNRGKK